MNLCMNCDEIKKFKVFFYIYIFSYLDNNNLKILNKYFVII